MSYGHQQGAPRRPDHGRQPGYGRPPGQRRPAYHETRALPIPPTEQPPHRPGPPRDPYDRRRGGPPPQGYGAQQRPPRPPRKRRFGRKLLIFFAVLVLALGGVWVWLDMSLNRVAALSDYPGRPAEGAGANWLIVGSDSREDLSDEQKGELATGDASGQRTDTMMLLHVPDNDTKPTLVSLLRDSYVEIPGNGMNKLNAAYAIGGPQLLAQTVEVNTGLRLDHYAEVGLGGFADVVDAVGGVEMCVDEPINDPLAGLKLEAGCQELNGAQALGYVRTRATPRADLDRVVHQREFIGALTDKISSPGTLLNPFRLFPVLANAPDAVTVDEGDHLHHLPSLAFAIAGTSDGSTVSTTVPLGGSDRTDVGSVVLWDEDKAGRMFEALRTDQPVPEDTIVKVP
ncbi:MAG TPA: LCP family protein [Actinophytocola sp.]|nr:LCP family protein [Actinophytocola sp.]